MKKKLNILVLITLFSCIMHDAIAVTIIPIPIHSTGNVHLTDKQALSIPIALNLIFLIFYLIRILIWIVDEYIAYKTSSDRIRYSFLEFVFNLNDHFLFVYFVNVCFIIVNGLSLIIWLCYYISTIL